VSTARCCDCGSRFERKRDEAWKTRCTPCWIRMRRAQQADVSPRLQGACGELPERLRALMQLAHPDRHNNSELANSITKWLLRVREEIEEAPR
jgi:hypothetical protein